MKAAKARTKAKDPDRWREKATAASARFRERHRPEYNAYMRDYDRGRRANDREYAEPKRASNRGYYERRGRDRYRANKEKATAQARAWRERTKTEDPERWAEMRKKQREAKNKKLAEWKERDPEGYEAWRQEEQNRTRTENKRKKRERDQQGPAPATGE